jgi:pterin-4a-carbinolamine dehydratase
MSQGVSTGSTALVFYDEYPFRIEGSGRTALSEDLRSAAELFKNDPDYIHSYMVCKISLWGHSIVPYTEEIYTARKYPSKQLEHFQEVIAEVISWMTVVEGLEIPPITYYTSDLQPILNQNMRSAQRRGKKRRTQDWDIAEDTLPGFMRPTVSKVFTTHNYTTAYKTWDTRFNQCFQESPDCSIISINR